MLLGLVSTAGAESTVSTLPIKVELDFSKYQFTAPEEITVTIRVTNVTDEKFTSPVSVLDPNGSIIEAFGTPLLDAGEPGEKPCTVRLGGPTCLAGDVIGDYSFAAPLTEGQRLIFGDMAIYSTCKNNTFNGMPLPDIWQLCADGTLRRLAHFGYGDFKYRLGSRGGSAQPTTSVQI